MENSAWRTVTTGKKEQIAEVFSRAAESYDRVGPDFFSHFGHRLVELVEVRPGATVLDVATGTGAALLPAAERARPGGRASSRSIWRRTCWRGLGKRSTARAATCMTFTRQACRMLPEPLQQEVARKFRKVNPQAVRASAQQAASSTPDGKPARTATEARPPSAAEWMGQVVASMRCRCRSWRNVWSCSARRQPALLDTQTIKEEHSPLGRWRHTARDGKELLLVRREVLAERITQLGGRPETVFAVWKGAWVLRPGEGDRLGYRLGASDSRSLLAFRWSKLRALGFPGPPLEPVSANVDEHASG